MKRYTLLSLLFAGALSTLAQRTEQTLTTGWTFMQGDVAGAEAPDFNDASWKRVSVPHDWAITGPFDRKNDLQVVAVTQNGETEATEHTGRTGGLPYVGVGWYRCKFRVNSEELKVKSDELKVKSDELKVKSDGAHAGHRAILVFDGAMSQAKVFVNGREAIFWPFGYNTFYCDVTDLCTATGEQQLAVRLENVEQSSRWYSGAGLFRNVHLIETEAIHVPVWGTQVTTELHNLPQNTAKAPQNTAQSAACSVQGAPDALPPYATITLKTSVEGCAETEPLTLYTEIIDDQGKVVAAKEFKGYAAHGLPLQQNFTVEAPHLWSPETPNLYRAVTRIYAAGRLQDTYTTRFGIRSLEYVADKGFFLNGERRKFQGVCNHHDLGPLGAAVNRTALRHQLQLLKDMGCDAIRTSHNMPAPELVEMCDEMGIMLVVESFDMWDLQKTDNDYHKHFGFVETHKTLRNPNQSYTLSPNPNLYTWAERDMINMLHHYRNNPSVMMWSIGNEVWNQTKTDGWKVAKFLQDICHREDPTRPVTCGMDQLQAILDNNFAATIDIPGLNYRTARYQEAYEKLPQKMILGSETASTVSSRGTYKFPVQIAPDMLYSDNQSTGYDVEYCSWSGLPDQDFALQDDYPWTIGQFVWTGFDYLGEPSPYDTDAWPSHSSYFGIIDLAALPKDRYWLYRSQWNTKSPTLHALPHWTWPGREGEQTPVFVYTTYPETELFINGQSEGRRVFASREEAANAPTVPVGEFEIAAWGCAPQPELLPRYRMMWLDAIYQPGEMKVYAYAHKGDSLPVDSVVYTTAQKPHHLAVQLANEAELRHPKAQGLHYFTVSLEDADGVPFPTADQPVEFVVTGDAYIAGAANGDAASLDPLQPKQQPATTFGMHLFAGQCTVLVQANGPFCLKVQPAKNAQPSGIRPAVWSNIPDKRKR